MSVITARSSRRTAGPVFVAPFLLLFVLLFLAPLGYAAYLSLFEHKLIINPMHLDAESTVLLASRLREELTPR